MLALNHRMATCRSAARDGACRSAGSTRVIPRASKPASDSMRVFKRCRKGGTWRSGSASSDGEGARGWTAGAGTAFSASADCEIDIAPSVVALGCLGVGPMAFAGGHGNHAGRLQKMNARKMETVQCLTAAMGEPATKTWLKATQGSTAGASSAEETTYHCRTERYLMHQQSYPSTVRPDAVLSNGIRSAKCGVSALVHQ